MWDDAGMYIVGAIVYRFDADETNPKAIVRYMPCPDAPERDGYPPLCLKCKKQFVGRGINPTKLGCSSGLWVTK